MNVDLLSLFREPLTYAQAEIVYAILSVLFAIAFFWQNQVIGGWLFLFMALVHISNRPKRGITKWLG
ncbi:MAG: hypothetical protein AAGH92_10420 [Planctomycetota bacterium]